MVLRKLTSVLIGRAEKRIGVSLDYARLIARTDFWLLMRYNKIFGVLDPNTKVPAQAYHAARLRGAIAADCGTCVTAEINLAKSTGLNSEFIDQLISGMYHQLPEDVAAVAKLADAVVGLRNDDPKRRDAIIARYGNAGLIELSFAMNGAAMLPGIKRAMGFAAVCDLDIAKKLANS